MFCPAGTAPGTEYDDPHCLGVSRDPGAAGAGTLPDGYQSWRATTLGGVAAYVSPDGRAVASVTGGALLTVTAGAEMPVTAADLAAILRSIPG